jgi:hypothetical protein
MFPRLLSIFINWTFIEYWIEEYENLPVSPFKDLSNKYMYNANTLTTMTNKQFQFYYVKSYLQYPYLLQNGNKTNASCICNTKEVTPLSCQRDWK